MTEGCVMTLTQGRISEFMVTVHTYPKPCTGHKLSLPSWILITYHTITSWPWLRDISPMSRSQFTHGKIFFPDNYLSWVPQMGMILHTIVIHDPGVVVAGGICPVRTCLVWFGERWALDIKRVDNIYMCLWKNWVLPVDSKISWSIMWSRWCGFIFKGSQI